MHTDTVSIELKRTFTTASTRYVVTAEIKPAQIVAPYLTVDLLPASKDSKSLSISAVVYELSGGRWRDAGGGQCQDSLRADFPNDPTVQRLCDLWDAHHLGDMNAGSREQQAIVDAWVAAGNRYDYSAACEVLRDAGKLEVPMPAGAFADSVSRIPGTYKYGSAWLSSALPADVEAEVRVLMTPPPDAPRPVDPDAANRAQLAKQGIKMTVEYADRNPNMPESRDANHYKCVFSRGRKRMTVYFSMGYGLKGEPTINQVWNTITEDSARVEEMDFADFCSEYGYEEDSRKAERTFKACKHQANRLSSFLA